MRKSPFAVLLAVAACAAPRPALVAPPPVVFAPIPGLERIIGKPPAAALALLGLPGLDRHDGPGRHLQFVRAGCVLDLYYYPDPKAGEPTARFAEARLASGTTDSAARCFAAQTAPRG